MFVAIASYTELDFMALQSQFIAMAIATVANITRILEMRIVIAI